MEPKIQEELNTRDYLRVLFKRKRMIILLFLTTLLTVFIGNYILRPTYEASSKILIEGPRGQTVPYARELGEVVPLSQREVTKTQSEIIKSLPIVEEVVRILNLDTRQKPNNLRERIYRLVKNGLKATKRFYWKIKKFFITTIFGMSFEEPQELTDFRKAVEYLMKEKSLLGIATIEVEPIEKTDIIVVKVRDRWDPEMAAKIANTLINIYINKSLDIKGGEAKTTYHFITEQLKEVELKLRNSEEALKRFKEKTGVVSISTEVESRVARLADFEASYANTQAEIKEVGASLEEARQQLAEQAKTVTSSATVSKNPLIEELRSKLANLEIESSSLLKSYKENHPRVVEIKTAIANTKEKIGKEIENIVSSEVSSVNPIHRDLSQTLIGLETRMNALQAKERALITIISKYRQQLENLAEEEVGLARLSREVETHRKTYATLMDKQQEALLAEAMKIENLKIIEPAVAPLRPIRPRKNLNLFLGGIGSLVVGFGLAFLLECIDHSLKNPEEVERYLGLSVLGSIPKQKVSNKRLR